MPKVADVQAAARATAHAQAIHTPPPNAQATNRLSPSITTQPRTLVAPAGARSAKQPTQAPQQPPGKQTHPPTPAQAQTAPISHKTNRGLTQHFAGRLGCSHQTSKPSVKLQAWHQTAHRSTLKTINPNETAFVAVFFRQYPTTSTPTDHQQMFCLPVGLHLCLPLGKL